MSSTGRPKRAVSVPKKFAIEEGYTLPDSPEKRQEEKRVLRYLNETDVQSILRDLTVYVLWPEDNLWYEAVLQKPSKDDQGATLFYTDTAEEEDVNLDELVHDKHIAFLENRSSGEALKSDELSAENLIHLAAPHSTSEASDFGDGSSGHDESSLAHDGQSRPKKEATAVHLIPSNPSRLDGLQILMSGEQGPEESYFQAGPDMDGCGMATLAGRGAEKLVQELEGGENPKLKRYNSVLSKSSSGSREAPLRLDVMTKLREKAIEQLKGVLKPTESEGNLPEHDEMNPQSEIDGEQNTELKPDASEDLAKTIEIEMLKTCGGDEILYKRKLRSLYFNLKESRNPELRRQVLSNEIPAEHLVAMSASQLASQELNEWRQKKKEELLQATVLDEDAAAKFSTAAALKQSESRKKQRLKDEQPDISIPVNVPKLPVVDEGQRLEEMQVDQGHAIEESDSGSEEGTKPLPKLDSVEERPPLPSVEPPPRDEELDLEEIPDWAMEVVEAPTPPVQSAPVAPQLYSPKAAEERNNSAFGPVPIRPTPPDLTPLLVRDDSNCVVGETVWQGEVSVPERSPFRAQCVFIAGKCNLKAILTTPQIVVYGRMNMKKVEQFLEKLRGSKTRTVTIAILKPPLDATHEDFADIQENIRYFLTRERTGAMQLGDGVEGYLITKCSLTSRLMMAAQILMENVEKVPNDIGFNDFLLVCVHKKDRAVSEMHPSTGSVTQETSEPVTVSDPRIRAGIKPAGPSEKKDNGALPLPSGLTLQSISNLAAMLGLQKPPAVIPSAPNPLPNVMSPHQMSVPVAVTAPLPPQAPNPSLLSSTTAVPSQPERPKFLIFEPATNKVTPINPAGVHYDPNSNRVMLVGQLPQGFAVQPLSSSIEPPVGQDNSKPSRDFELN